MQTLADRGVVVTGGASGIGLATARRMAADGARVVIADVEERAVAEAAAALQAESLPVWPAVVDVTDRASVDALRRQAVERLGAVHVLVTSAGVVGGGPIGQIDPSTWDWVLGVNLWGTLRCIEAFLPGLEAGGEGHVVTIASSAGLQPSATIAPYNISKAAVISLSETLAVELDARQAGVGVSVVCPHAVRTRIVASARNRPGAEVQASPDEAGFQRHRTQLLEQTGMDPAAVADRILDAVLHDRFWVITHDEWLGVVQERAAAMRDGRLHRHAF